MCAVLELKTIISAEIEELQIPITLTNKTSKENFTHSYTVLFEVSPSNGIFESRLLYHKATRKIQLHSEILRINRYGQTSACIQDKYDLRSFCYCVSYNRRSRYHFARGGHQYSLNTTVITTTTKPATTTTKPVTTTTKK